MGQLSTGIAHEIRNPLGSIQGAIEILGNGLPPGDPKLEFAQIAKKEVANLNRLVNEILQYSRPAPPRRMQSNIREIIDSACRLCSNQAVRQGVNIAQQYDIGALNVFVDPEQIKQVLLNILINAIQAQQA